MGQTTGDAWVWEFGGCVVFVGATTAGWSIVDFLSGGGILLSTDGDDLRERDRHVIDGRAAVAGIMDAAVKLLEGEVAAQVVAYGCEGRGGSGHALRSRVWHDALHVEHPDSADAPKLGEWGEGCARLGLGWWRALANIGLGLGIGQVALKRELDGVLPPGVSLLHAFGLEDVSVSGQDFNEAFLAIDIQHLTLGVHGLRGKRVGDVAPPQRAAALV